MGQAGNDKSHEIGDAPEQPVPHRTVVERVIKINQEWRVGLELVGDRRDGSLRVGDVMKNAERESEIE